MPRDKSETNAKIITHMREEFLTYGYERASLNRISSKVGITTAALYKHFRNKEDMFYFLVKDTLNDLREMNAAGQREMELNPAYNPFEPGYAEALVDFIYGHYEGFKLLICCSEGSPYESFEEELVRIEAETNKEYAGLLQDKTGRRSILTDMEWHLLSTAYIHLISEIVRHDMPKEDAKGHMEFVCRLLYPGWKELLGIKE